MRDSIQSGTAKRILTQALEDNAHLPQDVQLWEHYLSGMDEHGGFFLFGCDRHGLDVEVRCHKGGRQTVTVKRS